MKHKKIYELKHFDNTLLEFEFSQDPLDLNDVNIIQVNNGLSKLLPKSLDLSDLGLKKWLKNRSIPKNREFIKELIDSMGLNINNVQNIIDISKGLSLNDAYWINKKGDNIKFNDINLYDNDFSEAISFIAFTSYSTKIEELCSSPEFTTNGMLPKCWRRIDNNIILFKSGTKDYANAGNEPYSEYYASQIAEQLGYKHVKYDLEKWKGILASTCPLFTSKYTGYIPIAYYVPSGSISVVNKKIKQMDKNIYKDFQRMILFDSIIYNKDRHFGNFGFLIDNKTMEIKCLNPTFDNGAGLFAYALDSETKNLDALKEYANKEKYSYYGIAYNDLVKEICTKDMMDDLRKLINFKFKKHPHYNLSSERLNTIEHFINERVIELMKIVEKCPKAEKKQKNR